MKIKLSVAREIQYFELGIFSFNSYVCYLTRGFSAPTCVFNLLTRSFNLPTRTFNSPTRAFNLATHAFILLTRAFELVTREFELVTRVVELVTRGFELVTRGFELETRGRELVTCEFELVTRNSCFTFAHICCQTVGYNKGNYGLFKLKFEREGVIAVTEKYYHLGKEILILKNFFEK